MLTIYVGFRKIYTLHNCLLFIMREENVRVFQDVPFFIFEGGSLFLRLLFLHILMPLKYFF